MKGNPQMAQMDADQSKGRPAGKRAATRWLPMLLALTLAACAPLAPTPAPGPQVGAGGTAAPVPEAAREVVLGALGLLETGYRFGGKNPEAGLDCSGMVNYVFQQALGRALGGSAADMARRGTAVELARARPGDLAFFNTRGGPYTHVGIYLGEGRFVHAPSSKGRVRIDRLDAGWFAPRLTELRRYID